MFEKGHGPSYPLSGPPFPMPAGAGGILVGECRPSDNGGNWCLINWKGASGWTSSRGIEVDPTVTWRVRSGVSQGILNVRVGPGGQLSSEWGEVDPGFGTRR